MSSKHSEINFSSLKESKKVPLPGKMYTHPVDVNKPHKFKSAANYDPIQWNEFWDSKEMYKDVLT